MSDNVFRQADKLIVKPETYNLVVKDKTTFKIFLQNNMDRGIADISLIAESPVFDFTIKHLCVNAVCNPCCYRDSGGLAFFQYINLLRAAADYSRFLLF